MKVYASKGTQINVFAKDNVHHVMRKDNIQHLLMQAH